MESHLWFFPWLALLAGAVALAVGLIGSAGRLSWKPGSAPPGPLVAVWVVLTGLGVLASLRVGKSAGVDFVPARGLLLGSLAGAALAELCRRIIGDRAEPDSNGTAPIGPAPGPPYLAPVILGGATAAVAIGRLWLTHGEISGLSALALGAALALLCLGVAPGLADLEHGASAGVLALLYLVTLAAAVELGFTRAGVLKDMVWADVPLLMGGVLSLSALIGAGAARGRNSSLLLFYAPVLCGGALSGAVAWRLVHSWRPVELLALGAVAFGLPTLMGRRTPGAAAAQAAGINGADAGTDSGEMLTIASCLEIVAAGVLAFALWSGYGLGLLLMGGWLVACGAFLQRDEDGTGGSAGLLTAGLGFAAVLLIHRLLLLQSGPGIRITGPGDTWDVFAIALGVLLPIGLASWLQTAGRRAWTNILEWVVIQAAAAILVGYVWGARFAAGVLLGAAVGQLLASLLPPARERPSRVALSGVTLSLFLLVLLPIAGEFQAPTRPIRAGILIVFAIVAAVRLLVGGQRR